jgi:hypothetical protein
LAVRRLFITLLTSFVALSCLGQRPIKHPERPQDVATLTLAGQFSIRALTRFPPVIGLPFGGISGLTSRDAGREIYGISDAQLGGRIYRFALEGLGGSLRVDTLSVVSLSMAPGDTRPDHEGIVLLSDGTFAVSAEGTGREPRLPPSINIYGRHGDFVSRLPVPDPFVPEATGPATRGARGNAGFESLTLSPDGDRLFTAAETALIQDGETATFEAGARTRILEYAARRGAFEPARQFAYDLEPVQKPPATPGLYINGLVELLAVNRTTLLALERGYVANKANPAQSRNRIRLYRVDLTGATDVSQLESLRGHQEIVPVTKSLLMDLSEIQGLSPDLAPSLDNFEGMAFGPRLPDGRASLLIVSDDNFSEAQRTWFLLFAIQ